MGVLALDEFNRIVNQGVEYLKKDDLIKFAEKHNVDIYKKGHKQFIAKAIYESVDVKLIYEEFKNEQFGVISSYLQKLLGVDHKMIKNMEKQGFIHSYYAAEYRIYGQYRTVPYYSIENLLDLEQEQIEAFVKANTKVPTEKQKEALKKAAATRLKKKTCEECGEVQRVARDLNEDGICNQCVERKYFRRYLEKKNKYIILDTETTGLEDDDEIIEISIIDTEGNILLNTLVSTEKPISDEAYDVHGISHEELKGKPTIKELAPQLDEIFKNKVVLIYNSDFDRRMLTQSGYEGSFKSICLMRDYMGYMDSEKYISLSKAMYYEDVENVQVHRALGDCYCCLELIKAIAYKKNMVE
ncbi:3'-5' exonuclease [Clostridium sp.]|uniref:3'-5' exonuclease n=1 Tax=Clostridium sp. TaxID=1506 RepID=UPI002FC953BD